MIATTSRTYVLEFDHCHDIGSTKISTPSPCLSYPVFADREMVYWGKSDGMGGDGRGGDGNVIGSTLGTITTTATMR